MGGGKENMVEEGSGEDGEKEGGVVYLKGRGGEGEGEGNSVKYPLLSERYKTFKKSTK